MIRHLVLFKFKSEIPKEEQERLAAKLSALPAAIPEIRQYEVGFDVTRSSRCFDAAICSLFDDVAALSRYQQHPEHAKIAGEIAAACVEVVVADYEV